MSVRSAFSSRPPTVVRELDDRFRPLWHAGAMESCVFCSIIAGELDAEVVYADDVAVAFLDRTPLFHGHTLVVPREHLVTMADLPIELVGPFYERVQLIAAAMPDATGKPGTFIASNNVVSQSVAHLHVHVVPRQRKDGLRGFFWPRTRYGDGEAAAIAARIRSAIGAIRASRSTSQP